MACKGCGKCYFKRFKFVGGRGNPAAEIVFVGESAGSLELKSGLPFSGQSGKVLFDCLPDDITSQDYYITNSLQCLPRKTKDANENHRRMSSAVRVCNSRLVEELKAHPRKVIVAMGNSALWSLTGNDNYKITRERGKLFPSEYAERGIVATVHPSYLLRGGGSLHKFKADIEYALDLAAGKPERKPIIPMWSVASSVAEVHDFIDHTFEQAAITGSDVLGADIETGGFDHRQDEMLELGWCVEPEQVFIVPENLLQQDVLHYRGFADSHRMGGKFKWLWQNGKFDIKFMRGYGYEKLAVDHDLMLQSYSMNEQRGFHDLEQISSDLIGAPDYKKMIDGYNATGKNGSYRNIPTKIRYHYLALDVSNTLQDHNVLYPRVCRDKLSNKLYHKVLLPASETLTGVETNGMLVDFEAVDKNTTKFLYDMEGPKEVMNEWSQRLVGTDINPNSPKQLNNLIYKELKLGKHDKSIGTSVDVIEKLPDHEFLRALSTHRTLAKAYGTYVKSLRNQVSDDGRVHSTYLIHGTATGRLSSRGPNMQNQPRGPVIRNQFVAAPGHMFVAMDLSQAELRCLATLSNDKNLMDIYLQDGLSLHKEVSVALWGESWKERYGLDQPGNPIYDNAYEEYMRTKALNFGIVYGRESFSIADEFSVTPREAQKWIDGWADRFPDAWDFIKKCRRAPVRGQNLITPFGRRKRAGVVSRDKLRDLQNEAANFPHQSIASDITLMSAVYVDDWLREHGVKIVNIVHDDIIVEMPIDFGLFVKVSKHVTGQMQQTPIDWGLNKVPFKSDAKIGYRWGSMKEVPMEEEAARNTLMSMEKPSYNFLDYPHL